MFAIFSPKKNRSRFPRPKVLLQKLPPRERRDPFEEKALGNSWIPCHPGKAKDADYSDRFIFLSFYCFFRLIYFLFFHCKALLFLDRFYVNKTQLLTSDPICLYRFLTTSGTLWSCLLRMPGNSTWRRGYSRTYHDVLKDLQGIHFYRDIYIFVKVMLINTLPRGSVFGLRLKMVTLPGRKGKVTGVYQVHITLWDMRMCDWLKMDNASGNKSWDGMLCANIAIECLIKMLMLFCLNVLFTLWPTFFKFGHLLSEKGSLLTRQAVHTRTFTWKAAWKIQLYFTKVLLHSLLKVNSQRHVFNSMRHQCQN